MPGLTADERELSQRLVEAMDGSSEAFAELLAPFRQRLFGYLVRSCGQRTLAEDLLQETLLQCWQALPEYDHRGRFGAWLFTIARNTIRDIKREQARRPVGNAIAPIRLLEDPVDTSDPESEMELRQRAVRVQRVVNSLPERQREVFLLRVHGNLTFREIAQNLGHPLGTVLSYMHRAVGKVRKEIERHDKH